MKRGSRIGAVGYRIARVAEADAGFAAAGRRLLVFACLAFALSACGTRPPDLEPIQVFEDAHSGGNALAISPDSGLAASAGWAGRIRVWRLPDGVPLGHWRTPHGDLSGLMFLPQSRRLLSTGRDGVVRIWELNGRLSGEFAVGSGVTSFHPGGAADSILLGHRDGRVSHWSVDGRRLGLWRLSESHITAVALDRSAQVFAAGDDRGRVWRWRVDGSPGLLQPPPTHVRSLGFHPVDASLLGSGWFKLYRWPSDAASLREMPTAHRGIVNHLQFSADGRFVATISRQTDSSILLLSPETGETLSTFRKHALCGQRVVLSPDGNSMVTNSDDASVRFYSLLPTADEPGGLTAAELSGRR